MSFRLANADLRLTLETAGETYRSSRFDWNGLIVQARWRGTALLGQEKPWGQRDPRRFGRGLHNEFGIKAPIGYDDCPVGGWFPKIGTGWLKKDHKPYFFYDPYELDRLEFGVERDRTRAVFRCASGERNGYAYRYAKTIGLTDDGWTIDYRLENLGAKRLATTEYVHNFLRVAGKPIGPGYELRFPWTIAADELAEAVDPDGAFRLDGDAAVAVGRTKAQFFFGGLSGGRPAEAGWELVHRPSGLALRERGDFPAAGVDLWGWRDVVSPELFHRFDIGPGEAAAWRREYRVRML
jgi:hypothetical protein